VNKVEHQFDEKFFIPKDDQLFSNLDAKFNDLFASSFKEAV
jgi:hypothetical protein